MRGELFALGFPGRAPRVPGGQELGEQQVERDPHREPDRDRRHLADPGPPRDLRRRGVHVRRVQLAREPHDDRRVKGFARSQAVYGGAVLVDQTPGGRTLI